MMKVIRLVRRNWTTGANLTFAVLLFTGYTKVAMVGYVLLLAYILDELLGISRAIRFYLMWWTRKPRRYLLWWFGRRYYWVHRDGIVEVVIRERDSDMLWSAMEYRTRGDGTKGFNNFCASSTSFYTDIGEAIAGLIAIRDYELNAVREYHERRANR